MTNRIRSGVLTLLLIGLITTVNAVGAQDKTLTIWTVYNSDSPQNDQDKWMAALIEEYQAEGVTLKNVTRPFDTISTDLNLALLSGGDVPDVSYVSAAALSPFAINGTLLDLRDFISQASWKDDLDPVALAGCTAPTGEILCIPTTMATTLTYYWTDAFPKGYNGSIEGLAANTTTKYALTGKSADVFGFDVFFFPLLTSYGVKWADETGLASWASPQAVKGIEAIRTLYAAGKIPDTALATGFDYETNFKDGSAGAFLAGSWSYVFLNPLKTPAGKDYPADSTAVEKALVAGDLQFAPPIHTQDGKPATLLVQNGWAIPKDAKDIEGAKSFIDWDMTTARNVAYAKSYGGLPTLKSGLADEAFKTPYWTGVADLLEKYGVPQPAFFDSSAAKQKFADTVVDLIQNPDKDIMTTLQTAQDEYNAEVTAARGS
ncbi:MAG: extracellular solute-binding protein [Anaerolineaceae bacterium]|nr:extracellular solute-binding protein [Anaerolineaceae bacterium]